jgi:hypothetical protein
LTRRAADGTLRRPTREAWARVTVPRTDEEASVAIYVEYISRRAGIALEGFQQVAGAGQPGWAARHDVDILVLNVGRTWRLGPEPEYIAIWHTPTRGIERLGEWHDIFEQHTADDLELTFNAVARIDEAGFYDALREPVPGRGGPLYHGEFFDVADGATLTDVAGWYGSRAERSDGRILNLVADRIGHLGPDPRGIAFWQLPSYEAIEPIAREVDGDGDAPVRLVRAGLYADIGREVL